MREWDQNSILLFKYNTIFISFGNGEAGKRTGIIFNTGMNDFSVPSMKNNFDLKPSPGNYIAPRKRAQSSMSPIIVTNTNGTEEKGNQTRIRKIENHFVLPI